jgi:hypothetical protein
MLTGITVGGRRCLRDRELVCERPSGDFARVFRGERVRDRGVLIGARRRRKQNRINRIDSGDRAVSGLKIGSRLKTTLVLMCGSHASVKEEKRGDTVSGGGVGWAVGRFLAWVERLPLGPFIFF